jgi:hypothetical protein
MCGYHMPTREYLLQKWRSQPGLPLQRVICKRCGTVWALDFFNLGTAYEICCRTFIGALQRCGAYAALSAEGGFAKGGCLQVSALALCIASYQALLSYTRAVEVHVQQPCY